MAFDQLVVDRQDNAKNRYLAKMADCRRCPVNKACKGKTPQEKRLHDTVYKACYERMLARLASRLGKRLMRLRAATVKPVLGSLITRYGLRHLSKKRQTGADKVLYVAAMAYNIEKYLRATPQQPASRAMALPLPGYLILMQSPFCNSHYTLYKYSTLTFIFFEERNTIVRFEYC